MQMCKSHWWLLKESVYAAGLWPLVAKDSEQVDKRLSNAAQADGINYDPLLDLLHTINAQALKMGGLYLNDESKNYCPLCEANKYLGAGTDLEWVRGCMESVTKFCREHSIIPPSAREKIREIFDKVERLPASSQQIEISILLNELVIFIMQDDATRFVLHNTKE